MRGHVLIAICAMVTACAPPDPANMPISLPPPWSNLPEVPGGATIEAGEPVKLDARQQEAVVTGVIKWMKDPGSVSFGDMVGAKNSHGRITVCGDVNGRNSAGAYVGMSPFIGVLMGTSAAPDFVVVAIGSFGKDRAEVASLCQQSGIPKGA
jgi:hypothetical protein